MMDQVRSGNADYVPVSLYDITRLASNGRLRADLACVQVSPPDRRGYASLGISVDIAPSILKTAKTVIAEINPNMPRTYGDSLIDINDVTCCIQSELPLVEYVHPPVGEQIKDIARHVAEFVEDLREVAVSRGIRGFTASVLTGNDAAIAFVRGLGEHVEFSEDEDTMDLTAFF